MVLSRSIFKACLAGLVGLALVAGPTAAIAAPPKILSENVRLVTQAGGAVQPFGSVRDADGLADFTLAAKKEKTKKKTKTKGG